MVTKIIPHKWQNEAYINWKNNNYSGINIVPTSGGKTISAIICMLNVRKTCLIICHTEVLMKQWEEELRKFLDVDFDKTIGLYYGKEKNLKPITIALIQTLSKEYDKNWDNKFKMVIIDEIHNFGSENYFNFLKHNNFKMKLGLTATIERQDGEEDKIIDYMGGINYILKENEVKSMGLVSKFSLINCSIKLPKEEQDIYNEHETKLKKYMDRIKELTGEDRVNPFENIPNENQAVSLMKMHYRREFMKEKKFMATHYMKNRVAIQLIKENSNTKILMFNEINDNAKLIYDILKDEGYNPLILNSTTKKKQKEILEKYSTDKYNILIATKMIDEGFSLNAIDNAILVSGTKTKKQLKQRIGRLIRKSNNPQKKFYQLFLKDTRDEKYNDERTNYIDYADEYLTLEF